MLNNKLLLKTFWEKIYEKVSRKSEIITELKFTAPEMWNNY